MDASFYIHYLNNKCGDQKTKGDFPSFRLIPVNNGASHAMLLPRPHSESLLVKPRVDKNHPQLKFDCHSLLPKSHFYFSCLSTRQRHLCYYRHSLLNHLENTLNFTCNYINNAEFSARQHNNPFGILIFDFTADIVMQQANNTKSSMREMTLTARVLYCDFKTPESRFKLQAWTNPMEVNVWILLLFIVALCTFVCFISWSWNAKEGKLQLDDKRDITGFTLVIIGIILRQYCTAIERCVLLTSVGLAAITLTSMYETFITMELIAPTKPSIVNDLGQLVHDKMYKLYFKFDEGVINGKIVHIAYVNRYITEDVKRKRLVSEENLLFFNITNIPSHDELGDMNRKVALLVTSSHSGPEQMHLSVASMKHPKRECNFVKMPIIADPILAVFDNNMANLQLKVMDEFLISGLRDYWIKRDQFQHELGLQKLKRNNFTAIEVQGNEDFLTLKNLMSIFMVWGFVLAVAFLFWLIEVTISMNMIKSVKVKIHFSRFFTEIGRFKLATKKWVNSNKLLSSRE
jgi:hypothetical protein